MSDIEESTAAEPVFEPEHPYTHDDTFGFVTGDSVTVGNGSVVYRVSEVVKRGAVGMVAVLYRVESKHKGDFESRKVEVRYASPSVLARV